MTKSTKTIKQICKCENCGNEAEMVVTCTLDDSGDAEPPHDHKHAPDRVKGNATCSSCGNEADMWVNL